MGNITAGMFDHYTTVKAVQDAWLRIRANIPKWHNDGRTRAELACIYQKRADELRQVVAA